MKKKTKKYATGGYNQPNTQYGEQNAFNQYLLDYFKNNPDNTEFNPNVINPDSTFETSDELKNRLKKNRQEISPIRKYGDNLQYDIKTGTGQFDFSPEFQGFNALAQITTGVANMAKDAKTRRYENNQYLQALTPRPKYSYNDAGLNNIPIYKAGGETRAKFFKILHDGEVHGKKLTDKQRKFFGAMAFKKYGVGGDNTNFQDKYFYQYKGEIPFEMIANMVNGIPGYDDMPYTPPKESTSATGDWGTKPDLLPMIGPLNNSTLDEQMKNGQDVGGFFGENSGPLSNIDLQHLENLSKEYNQQYHTNDWLKNPTAQWTVDPRAGNIQNDSFIGPPNYPDESTVQQNGEWIFTPQRVDYNKKYVPLPKKQATTNKQASTKPVNKSTASTTQSTATIEQYGAGGSTKNNKVEQFVNFMPPAYRDYYNNNREVVDNKIIKKINSTPLINKNTKQAIKQNYIQQAPKAKFPLYKNNTNINFEVKGPEDLRNPTIDYDEETTLSFPTGVNQSKELLNLYNIGDENIYKNTPSNIFQSHTKNDTLDYLTSLNMLNKYGTPNVLNIDNKKIDPSFTNTDRQKGERAMYDFNINSMFIDPYSSYYDASGQVVAELAHSYQNQKKLYPTYKEKDKEVQDRIRRGLATYDVDMYETKGTTEYDAHEIIEPMLKKEYLRIKDSIKNNYPRFKDGGYNQQQPFTPTIELPKPIVENTNPIKRKPIVQNIMIDPKTGLPMTQLQADMVIAAQRNQNTGKITKTIPKSTTQKVIDVVSNPMTSAKQLINKQPVTGRGPRNIYDNAIDIVNPVTYAKAIKNTASNIVHPIETTKKLTNTGLGILGTIAGDKSTQPIMPGVQVGLDALMTAQAGKVLSKPLQTVTNKFTTPTNTYKSEVDWSKWNKEIPKNNKLINEYNTIEQNSKANGTWMKNSDGSNFEGTPEQFIQQNSENFKKAFPNGPHISYRGSTINNLTEIKSEKGLGEKYLRKQYDDLTKKEDFFGRKVSKSQQNINFKKALEQANTGIYTTNDYTTALNKYAKGNHNNVLTLYSDIRNPKISHPGESFIVNESSNNNLQLQGYDALITEPSTFYPEGENVLLNNNQLKSAIGNNGMFDMTNPNIYKAVIPTVVGAGVISQKKYGGLNEGKELDLTLEQIKQLQSQGYKIEIL